jgi:hypothetical protein
MSFHRASQPDTTNARQPAYPGDRTRKPGARPLFDGGICAITPGIGGSRRDRASGNRTVVIVVGSSSHATHRVVGIGRRQQGRYSLVPSVIMLHVQHQNIRSACCR